MLGENLEEKSAEYKQQYLLWLKFKRYCEMKEQMSEAQASSPQDIPMAETEGDER